MISSDYVVVGPDYKGLGTKQMHPYLVGKSAAHSVLDANRAARSFPMLLPERHLQFGVIPTCCEADSR